MLVSIVKFDLIEMCETEIAESIRCWKIIFIVHGKIFINQ